ncbi:MAG: winged helix-turn-helix transcriptional regulator [Thermoanaerobaculia bacterium]
MGERRKSYGQFCPVALASELVAERWTPLVVRELLCGSRGFNDLHRGVPRMSVSLLARRLRELERAGIVERQRRGRASEYHLTEAGEQLRPIIESLGVWGKRWLPRRLRSEHLDPDLLIWDIRRRIRTDRLPQRRVNVQFTIHLPSRANRYYWLVLEPAEVDVCYREPGFPVNLEVRAELARLTAVWLGDAPLDAALRDRAIQLEGPRDLCRAFPQWLELNVFAPVERRAEARPR